MVHLPRDEGAHGTPLEWWYFNGHLTDDQGNEYSYHFVTFELITPEGFKPRLLQLSWHDHARGRYLTAEKPAIVTGEPTPGSFSVDVLGWSMQGDGGSYQLAFDTGEYQARLEAIPRKPAVLHQETGLVDMDRAGKSFYYTRPRLRTTGTLSIDGQERRVTGASWMDRQWGDFSVDPVGWDWLSLQLDDESELMVSAVWDSTNRQPIMTYGTYIPAAALLEGESPGKRSPVMHLKEEDITLSATGSWTSPTSKAEYPMGWELEVAPLDLKVTLTPVREDAEFADSKFVPTVYWEGAVSLAGEKDGGTVTGKGFVELVGYAPRPQDAQPQSPGRETVP